MTDLYSPHFPTTSSHFLQARTSSTCCGASTFPVEAHRPRRRWYKISLLPTEPGVFLHIPMMLRSGLIVFVSILASSCVADGGPGPSGGNDQQATLQPDSCSFNWPPGPGGSEHFQAPTSHLTSLLSQIDPNRIEAIITKLVSFGTRSTLSDKTSNATRGIIPARDWIASEMQSFAAASGGRMTVEVQTFVQQPTSALPVATNISNIVATLKGTTDPNRVYVVSGHYDSRVTDVTSFMSF